MSPEQLQALVVAIPGILIAITYHEIAHAWVADRLGDPTARMLGRLSPNPIKHIDPLGTVLLPLFLWIATRGQFLFGSAKPVPVNFRNLRRPRRDMALVAAAGPASNLLMAMASMILLRGAAPLAHPAGVQGILLLLLRPGTPFQPSGPAAYVFYPIALVLAYMVKINVLLALFNLIPVPPLDGGRILVGFLPRAVAARWAAVEPFGIWIVMAILVLDPLGIWSRGFGALYSAALGLLFL